MQDFLRKQTLLSVANFAFMDSEISLWAPTFVATVFSTCFCFGVFVQARATIPNTTIGVMFPKTQQCTTEGMSVFTLAKATRPPQPIGTPLNMGYVAGRFVVPRIFRQDIDYRRSWRSLITVDHCVQSVFMPNLDTGRWIHYSWRIHEMTLYYQPTTFRHAKGSSKIALFGFETFFSDLRAKIRTSRSRYGCACHGAQRCPR